MITKSNTQSFILTKSDETWYVGSSALKYYPCVQVLPMYSVVINVHIKYLILFAYTPKGGSHCIF